MAGRTRRSTSMAQAQNQAAQPAVPVQPSQPASRKPPDIDLFMECEDEDLTPWQLAAYKKAEKEFQETVLKINALKDAGGEVMQNGDDGVIIRTTTVTTCSMATAPKCTTPVQLKRGSLQKQHTPVTQPQASVPVAVQDQQATSQPSGSYRLLMDPRTGVIVGTMRDGDAHLGKSAISKVQTNQHQEPRMPSPAVALKTTQSSAMRNALSGGPNVVQLPKPGQAVGAPAGRPGPASVTVTKTPPGLLHARSVTAVRQPVPAAVSKVAAAARVPVKQGSPIMVDLEKEVHLEKSQGKTFPSLAVVARPLSQVPPLQAQMKRAELDARVKALLVYTPARFTEWLIQQGLVKSQQYCTVHLTPERNRVKLKLGMYSDGAKFPYSGGYVWISDCCPNRFVSVFNGSMFEGAPHPPTVILKLIYHWVCQTNTQNIVQWVKVDTHYMKTFFSYLRSICTVAVQGKFDRFGGVRKFVEVGVISLGTTSQDGNRREVRVEVLGVYNQENRQVRLRATEPPQENETTGRNRFTKILKPLPDWVDKNSVIITDCTVDKDALHKLGFLNVAQCGMNSSNEKLSNKNIMDYLRRVVPRMFQNTLSLLSKSHIQHFLDELVWRERWGTVSSIAFENILTHVSEQTKGDFGESLIQHLSKIAQNPFADWSSSNLTKEAATTVSVLRSQARQDVVQLSDTAVAAKTVEKLTSIGIDNLPSSIRCSVPGNSSSKRSSTWENNASAIKKARIAAPEELVELESYFYATMEGDKDILKNEVKANMMFRCHLCKKIYSNNLEFMKHLHLHAESAKSFNIDLSDLTQCKYCFKDFDTPYAMQSHLEDSHLKSNATLMCRICDEQFKQRNSLISHMTKLHTASEMPYACGVCGYRTSMHRQVIDHFQDVHNGTEKLMCHWCLKVFKGVNHAGVYFFQHIQRHQVKQIMTKGRCKSCKLVLHLESRLKEHRQKDHNSYKGFPGVTPVERAQDPIMLPRMEEKPVRIAAQKTGLIPQAKQQQHAYAAAMLENVVMHDMEKEMCYECDRKMIQPGHFSALLCCLKCRYTTCCNKAMSQHVSMFHTGRKTNFTTGQPIILPHPVYCICGFKTQSGNKMAKHLVNCEKKSCYPSTEQAATAIKKVQSASFPPLVTLDSNVEVGDPNEEWMKAFVPKKGDTGKQEEKKPQDKSGGEPPSMLNILGLVRKPSTDSEPEKQQSENEDSRMSDSKQSNVDESGKDSENEDSRLSSSKQSHVDAEEFGKDSGSEVVRLTEVNVPGVGEQEKHDGDGDDTETDSGQHDVGDIEKEDICEDSGLSDLKVQSNPCEVELKESEEDGLLDDKQSCSGESKKSENEDSQMSEKYLCAEEESEVPAEAEDSDVHSRQSDLGMSPPPVVLENEDSQLSKDSGNVDQDMLSVNEERTLDVTSPFIEEAEKMSVKEDEGEEMPSVGNESEQQIDAEDMESETHDLNSEENMDVPVVEESMDTDKSGGEEMSMD